MSSEKLMCPHCLSWVAPDEDGDCPNCDGNVFDAEAGGDETDG